MLFDQVSRVGRARLAKGVSSMKRIFAMLGSLAAVFAAGGALVRW
jgi:hypothetical protein